MYEDLMFKVLKIAKEASNMIEASKKNAKFSLKNDSSYVSEVDISVEKFISLNLKSIDPNTPVYGEELGSEGVESEDTYWLIDPIDGTAWYKMGIPVYGSLISLIKNGEPVIGCISLPGINKVCYAFEGGGCFVEEYDKSEKVPTQSSIVNHIKDATISASGIHGTSTWLENGSTPWELQKIFKDAKLFKFTGDCIQHVQVILGQVDAAIDTIMKPWDSAALIICLRESGSVVMNLQGCTNNLIFSETLLSASSEELALEIVEKIKPLAR